VLGAGRVDGGHRAALDHEAVRGVHGSTSMRSAASRTASRIFS
jgi:hypothetical protein